MLSVLLDSQVASVNSINEIIVGGDILHATAFINSRWGDYSALELVREVGEIMEF